MKPEIILETLQSAEAAMYAAENYVCTLSPEFERETQMATAKIYRATLEKLRAFIAKYRKENP